VINSSSLGNVVTKLSVMIALLSMLLVGCGGGGSTIRASEIETQQTESDSYVIGAGDGLQVFVWGHDDLSTTVQVRPDGAISTPLVEDMRAAGRTPTELARIIETELAEYVRSPTVTIIVQQFVGEYDRQIRVVGQAAEAQALSYRDGMTLLDVMIAVGGLSEFASGNKAKIVRRHGGQELTIKVRINDLLNKGDMEENVEMMPGDVLIIPESVF
jgi:polysaccharide export outer membrane protein